MTLRESLSHFYYDLILKKNITISLKSLECTVEIEDQGKKIVFMTLIPTQAKSTARFMENGLQYFRNNNLVLDAKKKQIIIARKHDFSKMTPDTFAFQLAQFHSEVLKYRQDLEEFNTDEYVLVPR